MKRLALLRHAKSSWAEHGLDDFDRPLNDRGRSAALRMGRELKQRNLEFNLVLASPAVRTRETLAGLEEGSELDLTVRYEPDIYLADVETLLAIIRHLPEHIEAPLLIGHNPGLQQLVLALTARDSRGHRARVAEKYPTAALAIVELPTDRWNSIQPGTGKLVELILPRDLD